MSPSHVRSLLVNSKLWKDQQRLSPYCQGRKSAPRIDSEHSEQVEEGDDPDMERIAKEQEPWVYEMFDRAVNEEKMWAEYLFKDGSMIGLNDKLLQQYVEWIANRRMKALGMKPQYDIAAKNNPLPWTEHWISSKGLQVAPQETEVESYVVGGIKQDVQKDTFAGFQL